MFLSQKNKRFFTNLFLQECSHSILKLVIKYFIDYFRKVALVISFVVNSDWKFLILIGTGVTDAILLLQSNLGFN